ncbi:MAG: hypothetical protein DRI71_06345, partial [Bacteroidetes bacterium]
NTVKVLLLGAVIISLGFWLPRLNNTYFDIFYRSAIVSVAYVMGVYFLNVSLDINQQIDKLLRRK